MSPGAEKAVGPSNVYTRKPLDTFGGPPGGLGGARASCTATAPATASKPLYCVCCICGPRDGSVPSAWRLPWSAARPSLSAAHQG